MIDLLKYIKGNKTLNILLMSECDIYFYKQSQETQFSSNQKYIPYHVKHLLKMAVVANLSF